MGSKPWTSSQISDKAGLEELAKKLNPVVGYWDPLNIGESSPETIGWFRHGEIKHGRVAMAAFVGYCVQSNGIHFPWNLQGPVTGTLANIPAISFGDISAAGGPADQWDALPTPAKLQILGVIGFLEMWSETSTVLEMDGEKHYVRGGKPGYFPALKGKFPHPVPLNRWDPFRLHLEDDARAQGEGAPRRSQQRPPRDDRHLRPDFRVQGTSSARSRLSGREAVRWRGHGPFQRGRRYTAFRQGHARLHRQHGLLKEGCLVSSSRMLSNGVL